eukprot:5269975-Prymnesium_polylepis.1
MRSAAVGAGQRPEHQHGQAGARVQEIFWAPKYTAKVFFKSHSHIGRSASPEQDQCATSNKTILV